ncbi:MAG: hypothetical protein HZA52_03415 [Planctomycetes bacterium]|nr:hypothetical protein [Planctomycetota bacterium]
MTLYVQLREEVESCGRPELGLFEERDDFSRFGRLLIAQRIVGRNDWHISLSAQR